MSNQVTNTFLDCPPPPRQTRAPLSRMPTQLIRAELMQRMASIEKVVLSIQEHLVKAKKPAP